VPWAWFIEISFSRAVACGETCAGRAAVISGISRFSGYRGGPERAFFS
jgi:hypothetical protein